MLNFPDPSVETEYTDPNTGIEWTFDGVGWVQKIGVNVSGGGDCNIPILDSPPANPELGEQWFSSTDGYLYIWYGAEWVAIGGAGGGDGGGSGGGAGDPEWSSVRLLINADGEANNSQNIVDHSGYNTVTVWNDAKISATDPKYGTGSVYFGGSDLLELPTQSHFAFGNQFTIEFWAKPDSVGAVGQMVANWFGSSACGFVLGHLAGGTINWNISETGSGSSLIVQSDTPLVAGVWQHVAICFTGSEYIMFLNGAEVGRASASFVPFAVQHSWTVGGRYNNTAGEGTGAGTTQLFAGYMDDIRVSIDRCRYFNAFTPTGPHPTGPTRSIVKKSPIEPLTQEDSNDADLS